MEKKWRTPFVILLSLSNVPFTLEVIPFCVVVCGCVGCVVGRRFHRMECVFSSFRWTGSWWGNYIKRPSEQEEEEWRSKRDFSPSAAEKRLEKI